MRGVRQACIAAMTLVVAVIALGFPIIYHWAATACFTRIDRPLDSIVHGQPWSSARQYDTVPSAEYWEMTLEIFERDFVRTGTPVLLRKHGLSPHWSFDYFGREFGEYHENFSQIASGLAALVEGRNTSATAAVTDRRNGTLHEGFLVGDYVLAHDSDFFYYRDAEEKDEEEWTQELRSGMRGYGFLGKRSCKAWVHEGEDVSGES